MWEFIFQEKSTFCALADCVVCQTLSGVTGNAKVFLLIYKPVGLNLSLCCDNKYYPRGSGTC